MSELWVSVGVLSDDLKKGLDDINRSVREAQDQSVSVSKGIGAGLAAAGLAAGALGLASIKMAGDMEQAGVAFSVMLGSAEKAQTVLGDLKTFAAETPFEFPEIQGAARSLLAFGTSAENLQGELKMIGDIASGIQVPIGELAEIYGKAQVQGRLFAEDINQLQGRGIPIVQELGKALSKTPEEIKKMVEQGKIGFPELQTAFQNLTADGAMFGGMMEAQSKTLLGTWSTFTDNAKSALVSFGETLISTFNITENLQAFSVWITEVAKGLAAFSEIVKAEGLQAAIDALIDPKVQAGIMALGGALIGALVPGLIASYTAFVAMLPVIGATALAMAPWIAAGAALAAAAYLIYRNWEPIKEFFVSAWKSVKDAFDKGVEAVTTFIKEWGPTLLILLTGPFGVVILEIIKHWDKIKAVFVEYGGAIFDYLRAVWEKVVIFAQELARPFIELGQTAKTWGRAMVEGLWQGISDAAGWLWGKITGWATELKDQVNSAFGIESPSKVFAEIGGQLSAGLVAGLNSSAGALQDTAVSMISAVASEINTRKKALTMQLSADYQLGGGITAEQAAGLRIAPIAAASMAGSETGQMEKAAKNEFNIQVSGVSSPDEVADAIYRRLVTAGVRW